MGTNFQFIDNFFEPDSIFSFEFIDRFTGLPIHEFFFLLPPESYTLKHNYKVNITKTLSGIWVDDFGNDIKDLNLSGSLWNYWLGTLPDVSSKTPVHKKLLSGVKKGLRNTLNSVIGRSITELILKDDRLTGLQEFFKLDYILNRFRGVYDPRNIPRNIPGINKLEVLSILGRKLYKDIKIVYHDYDDYHHFEVIINSFEVKRDKGGPFTLNYTISMKAIESTFPGLNVALIPPFFNIKENPIEFINSFISDVKLIQQKLADKTILPTLGSAIIENWNNLVNSWTSYLELIETFEEETNEQIINNQEINSTQGTTVSNIISSSNTCKTLSSNLEDSIITGLGFDIEEYEDGTIDAIDDDSMDFFILLNEINQILNETQTMFKLESPKILYQYHRINSDDSLRKLSIQYFGQIGHEQKIAEENNISDIQIRSGSLDNKIIKIPKDILSIGNKTNLIYFDANINSKDYSYYINNMLGIDIKFPLTSDGTGDLDIEQGYNNYIKQISLRFNWDRGSLNPIHIDWGLGEITGNVPKKIYLEKMISNIINQAKQDPRTSDIKIIDAFIEKDTIKYETEIKDIATEQFKELII